MFIAMWARHSAASVAGSTHGMLGELEAQTLQAWPQPETPMLMAGAGQLEQAPLNLLGNAAHATARVAGPTMHVGVRLIRGGRLAIEVRDTAPACRAAWSTASSCRSSAPANVAVASDLPWSATSCKAWTAACACEAGQRRRGVRAVVLDERRPV